MSGWVVGGRLLGVGKVVGWVGKMVGWAGKVVG